MDMYTVLQQVLGDCDRKRRYCKGRALRGRFFSLLEVNWYHAISSGTMRIGEEACARRAGDGFPRYNTCFINGVDYLIIVL
jgi:hypothetical protein